VNNNIWQSPLRELAGLAFRVTEAVQANINDKTLDALMAKADQARQNRQVGITPDKTYMIRFQSLPSERLLAVIFTADENGNRYNFIAYYDEVEHIFAEGWQNGDIKKFPGSPF